jgi:hypothetical protein
MDSNFRKEMKWWGNKPYQPYRLYKGDFLDPIFRDKIDSSTVILTNNFSFGPVIDQHSVTHPKKRETHDIRRSIAIKREGIASIHFLFVYLNEL